MDNKATSHHNKSTIQRRNYNDPTIEQISSKLCNNFTPKKYEGQKAVNFMFHLMNLLAKESKHPKLLCLLASTKGYCYEYDDSISSLLKFSSFRIRYSLFAVWWK